MANRLASCCAGAWLVVLLAATAAAAQELPEAQLLKNLKGTTATDRAAAASALGRLQDRRAVDALIPALQDSDGTVRAYAAQALGRIGDPKAMSPLIAILQDGDAEVRGLAAQALGELGGAGAVPALLTLLQDANPEVKSLAVIALGRLQDERAAEPLLPLLEDPNPLLRLASCTALGKLGDSGAVEPLAGRLRADPEFRVRAAAAQALGQINTSATVEPLIAALKDPDPSVRAAAAAGLGNSADPRAAEPLRLARLDPNSGGCPNPREPLPSQKTRYETFYLGVDLGKASSDKFHLNNKDSKPQGASIEQYDSSGCLLQRITQSIPPRTTLDVPVENLIDADRPVTGWYRITSTYDKLAVDDTEEVIVGNEVHTVERGTPIPRYRGATNIGMWLYDAASKRNQPAMEEIEFFVNLSSKPERIGVCQSDDLGFNCHAVNHEVAPLAEVMIPLNRNRRYTLLQSDSLPAVTELVAGVNGDVKQFHASAQILSVGTDPVSNLAPAAGGGCAQPPCRP